MFKLVKQNSRLVTALKFTHTFEVKCGNSSHFKYTKRSYHVLNGHQRSMFHFPQFYDDNKNATKKSNLNIKAPWMTVAFPNYSTGLDNLPEAPVAPTVIESTADAAAALAEPTFASLGLGGWSPVGLIQHAFEFMHISFDLPWWGCIAIGTLVVRLCVFPLVIMAQRNNALMNNHMPQIQVLQMKMTEARVSGNQLDTARYSQELMLFMRQKGLNPLKNALPILLQAPFFISFFVGLRRMANCPVESMKEGGLFWFTDLTIPDPLYLLPMLTSLTLYLTIEMGVDQMKTSNQTGVFIKYFLRAVPVIMLPFTINFPGAILCYWLSTNVISLFQVGFLKIPSVRDYFKIPKMIQHSPDTMPQSNKGFVTSAKESWSNMKITRELEDRQRADELIFNKAGKGAIVKTYKFDPTKHLTNIKAKDKDS